MIVYENDGSGTAKVQMSGTVGDMVVDVVVLCSAIYNTIKKDDEEAAAWFKERIDTIGKEGNLINQNQPEGTDVLN